MRKSISQSLKLCSVFACLAGLSACSENDAANVSFKDIDRSNLPSNIVPNNDLGASSTEWTGWSTNLVDTNGSQAVFSMESDNASQGGNFIKTSVVNVESATIPSDVQVGPSSVPVTAGEVYGVAAFVVGPRCGIGKFAVNAAGDPANVLSEQEFYFTGGVQAFDYYFQVPDTGVVGVDMPVQLSFADNIGGEIYIDRITAIPTVLPPPLPEGNVARNASFEENDTEINASSGDATWAQSGSATFTLVDSAVTEPHEGNNSVMIEFEAAGAGNPWDIEAGLVNVEVKDGFTYILSAWIKGDEGAQANFLVQNPTSYNVYAESAVTVTSEWQEVRFEAKITDIGGNEGLVRLYAQYNFEANANKTIYIDNIKLIPPDACPYAPVIPNMVTGNESSFEYDHVSNGGLESSDTTTSGWYTQSADPAVATFDVNKALSNTGENSLKTTITTAGTNSWDIQASPTDLEVVPGQTYIYSGWARGAVGTKAKFTAALQDDPYTTFEEHEVLFNGLWQQVTFDFTVPSTVATTLIRMPVHMSYVENEGERIFLDDFTLLPTNVSNGDLEVSDTEALGWSWQSANDIASFSLVSSEAHTGNNSLMINVGELSEDTIPNLWDVEVGIADIAVTGGLKYYISGRLKGSLDTKAKLLVSLADDPYTELASVGGTDTADDDDEIADGIDVNANWQEVTFEVVVPEGVERIRLMAHLGFIENSKRTIYLDTFRVVSQVPIEGNAVSVNPEVSKATVVSNGGLESSDLTAAGWSGYANGDGEATFSVDSTEAHSGNNSYKAVITTQAENVWEIEAGPDNLPITPGGSYIFSAWAKASAGSKVNFSVSMQEDPWTTFASKVLDVDGTWKQVSFDLTIPDDVDITEVRSRAQLSYAENVGAEIYIDDVILIPTLLGNGDFEASGDEALGWSPNGGDDYATFAVTQSEVHNGGNALLVDFSDLSAAEELNVWNIEASAYDLAVTGGLTYHFSGRIKGENGMQAKFLMGLQESPYSEFSAITVDVTSGWQEVTFDAVIPADVDIARVSVQLGYAENSSKSLYLDNFKVVPKVVLSNGGLESSGTDTEGWSSGGVTATLDTAEVQSGLNSLKVVLDDVAEEANPWDSQVGITGIPVLNDTTYKFTGWIKGEVGTTANFLVQLPVDPWSTFGSYTVEITDTDWQLVEFDSEIVTADALVNLQVHLGYVQNANTTFSFDNFKLMPIGSNPVEEVVVEEVVAE